MSRLILYFAKALIRLRGRVKVRHFRSLAQTLYVYTSKHMHERWEMTLIPPLSKHAELLACLSKPLPISVPAVKGVMEL